MKWSFAVAFTSFMLASIVFGYSMYSINQSQIAVANSGNQAVAGASTERTNIADENVATDISVLTGLINAKRVASGNTQLIEDTRLNTLAELRARDMTAHNYYSHTDSRGQLFSDYFAENGIRPDALSCENLLLDTARSGIVQQWEDSPGHRDCMHNGLMTHIGVAEMTFNEQTGQKVYVTIFAQQP